MTDNQPKALKLAYELENYISGDNGINTVKNAATELRRLHEENLSLMQSIKDKIEKSNKVKLWENLNNH